MLKCVGEHNADDEHVRQRGFAMEDTVAVTLVSDGFRDRIAYLPIFQYGLAYRWMPIVLPVPDS
jgi:hypothetical protein